MSKTIQDQDLFGDEVAYAYRMTTPPQRAQVAEDWDMGEKIKHKRLAELLSIDPDALLLASLLDAEHESVCSPSGRLRVSHYGKLRELIYKTVDNQSKTVDNSPETVDKVVDNMGKACGKPVEEIATCPQDKGFSVGCVENNPQGIELSPSYTQVYPQVLDAYSSRRIEDWAGFSTLSTPPTITTR